VQKVLLLDEPSLGLAPLVVQFIFETIGLLRKEPVSVMMVNKMADALPDSRAWIHSGDRQIIMEDVSDALINNPEVRKAFLGGSRLRTAMNCRVAGCFPNAPAAAFRCY
jgi:branched-chain amino acid transport system ATP-binding protein